VHFTAGQPSGTISPVGITCEVKGPFARLHFNLPKLNGIENVYLTGVDKLAGAVFVSELDSWCFVFLDLEVDAVLDARLVVRLSDVPAKSGVQRRQISTSSAPGPLFTALSDTARPVVVVSFPVI